MSKRSLPRSLRVTSAVIILVAAVAVAVVAISMSTVPALIMATCVALSAGITSTTLMSQEIRDLRHKWAQDRSASAKRQRERDRDRDERESSFNRAVAARLRASEDEIRRLRQDVDDSKSQIDELEERLATEQELTAMFGLRPEIDPAIVTPVKSDQDSSRRTA